MIVIEEGKAVRPCTLLRHLGFFIAILVLETWGDTGRHVHAGLISTHSSFVKKQLLHYAAIIRGLSFSNLLFEDQFFVFKDAFSKFLSLFIVSIQEYNGV